MAKRQIDLGFALTHSWRSATTRGNFWLFVGGAGIFIGVDFVFQAIQQVFLLGLGVSAGGGGLLFSSSCGDSGRDVCGIVRGDRIHL